MSAAPSLVPVTSEELGRKGEVSTQVRILPREFLLFLYLFAGGVAIIEGKQTGAYFC